MSEPDDKSYEELLAEWPPPFRGRAKPRPKMIAAEVSPRMHAAVKAKPDKLRMIAEDAQGNAVIERPYRPRREPYTPAFGDYGQRRAPEKPVVIDNGGGVARGEMKWGQHTPWSVRGIPRPPERSLRGDELVVHQYDIFAVLRQEEDYD
jgi:hypothetical protein